MAAQWPRIVDWMLTTLPQRPAWSQVSLFDGAPVTADTPTQYVTVGYVENSSGGSFSEAQDPSGGQWQETGVIRNQIVANSGDTSMSTSRALAVALYNDFESIVRADRTLGGTLAPVSNLTVVVEVVSVQNKQGSAQAFVLDINYFTVT